MTLTLEWMERGIVLTFMVGHETCFLVKPIPWKHVVNLNNARRLPGQAISTLPDGSGPDGRPALSSDCTS